MSGRRRALTISILVAILATTGLCLWVRSHTEPSFEGRSLTEWVRPINLAHWAEFNEEQTRGIRAIGTNALPTLLDWAQAEDGPGRQQFIKWLVNHPRIPIRHPMYAYEKKYLAARAFLALKELGKPAFPALLKMLNDTNTQWVSAVGLWAADPEAAKKAGVLQPTIAEN
jgi:hypothetical protein